jgi:membrane protease YdiL (CAAX protease family)
MSALLFGLAHLPGGNAGALAIVVTVVAGWPHGW